jgi:hypothetical protein
MNWGTKIVLGLAAFMLFIISLGVIMVSGKKDALVDNDYYEKGINYNKVYNRKEQTKNDHVQPAVEVSPEMIRLTFKQQAKGKAELMRTADKNLDRSVPFESDTANQVIIPAHQLRKGSWRLIIEWTGNNKSYLYEQEITL